MHAIQVYVKRLQADVLLESEQGNHSRAAKQFANLNTLVAQFSEEIPNLFTVTSATGAEFLKNKTTQLLAKLRRSVDGVMAIFHEHQAGARLMSKELIHRWLTLRFEEQMSDVRVIEQCFYACKDIPLLNQSVGRLLLAAKALRQDEDVDQGEVDGVLTGLARKLYSSAIGVLDNDRHRLQLELRLVIEESSARLIEELSSGPIHCRKKCMVFLKDFSDEADLDQIVAVLMELARLRPVRATASLLIFAIKLYPVEGLSLDAPVLASPVRQVRTKLLRFQGYSLDFFREQAERRTRQEEQKRQAELRAEKLEAACKLREQQTRELAARNKALVVLIHDRQVKKKALEEKRVQMLEKHQQFLEAKADKAFKADRRQSQREAMQLIEQLNQEMRERLKEEVTLKRIEFEEKRVALEQKRLEQAKLRQEREELRVRSSALKEQQQQVRQAALEKHRKSAEIQQKIRQEKLRVAALKAQAVEKKRKEIERKKQADQQRVLRKQQAVAKRQAAKGMREEIREELKSAKAAYNKANVFYKQLSFAMKAKTLSKVNLSYSMPTHFIYTLLKNFEQRLAVLTKAGNDPSLIQTQQMLIQKANGMLQSIKMKDARFLSAYCHYLEGGHHSHHAETHQQLEQNTDFDNDINTLDQVDLGQDPPDLPDADDNDHHDADNDYHDNDLTDHHHADDYDHHEEINDVQGNIDHQQELFEEIDADCKVLDQQVENVDGQCEEVHEELATLNYQSDGLDIDVCNLDGDVDAAEEQLEQLESRLVINDESHSNDLPDDPDADDDQHDNDMPDDHDADDDQHDNDLPDDHDADVLPEDQNNYMHDDEALSNPPQQDHSDVGAGDDWLNDAQSPLPQANHQDENDANPEEQDIQDQASLDDQPQSATPVADDQPSEERVDSPQVNHQDENDANPVEQDTQDQVSHDDQPQSTTPVGDDQPSVERADSPQENNQLRAEGSENNDHDSEEYANDIDEPHNDFQQDTDDKASPSLSEILTAGAEKVGEVVRDAVISVEEEVVHVAKAIEEEVAHREEVLETNVSKIKESALGLFGMFSPHDKVASDDNQQFASTPRYDYKEPNDFDTADSSASEQIHHGLNQLTQGDVISGLTNVVQGGIKEVGAELLNKVVPSSFINFSESGALRADNLYNAATSAVYQEPEPGSILRAAGGNDHAAGALNDVAQRQAPGMSAMVERIYSRIGSFEWNQVSNEQVEPLDADFNHQVQENNFNPLRK